MTIKRKTFYGITAVVLIFGGMLFESYLISRHQATTIVTVPYELPIELRDLGVSLGLNEQQLVDVRAQIGSDGGCSGLSHPAGCYDPTTDTIRILITSWTTPGIDPKAVLAYEYMHHVWEKETPPTVKAHLEPDIYTFYNTASRYPVFSDEFNSLSSEGSLHSGAITDELQAMACTEASDAELTPQLLAYCNRSIPNRSLVPREY